MKNDARYWATPAEIDQVLGRYSRFELHDGLLGAKSTFTQEWRDYYLNWKQRQIDYATIKAFERWCEQDRKRKAADRARRRAEKLKREAEHKALLEQQQREHDRLEREERAKREQLAAAEVVRRLAREERARFAELISTCYQLADGSIWLRQKPSLEARANEIIHEHVERMFTGPRDIQKLWRDTYDRKLHKF